MDSKFALNPYGVLVRGDSPFPRISSGAIHIQSLRDSSPPNLFHGQKKFRALRAFRGQKKSAQSVDKKNFVLFMPFVDKKNQHNPWTKKISCPSCLSWTKKFRALRAFRGQKKSAPCVPFVDKKFRALHAFHGQKNFVPFMPFMDKKISCPSCLSWTKNFVPFMPFMDKKISCPACLSWTKNFVPFMPFVDKKNFVPFVPFVDKKNPRNPWTKKSAQSVDKKIRAIRGQKKKPSQLGRLLWKESRCRSAI